MQIEAWVNSVKIRLRAQVHHLTCARPGEARTVRSLLDSPYKTPISGFCRSPGLPQCALAVLRWRTADTIALCAKAVVQTVRDSHGSHEPVPRNSSPDQAGSCQRCEFPQSAVRQAASTNPFHHRWAVENRESVCAGTVFAEIPERC